MAESHGEAKATSGRHRKAKRTSEQRSETKGPGRPVGAVGLGSPAAISMSGLAPRLIGIGGPPLKRVGSINPCIENERRVTAITLWNDRGRRRHLVLSIRNLERDDLFLSHRQAPWSRTGMALIPPCRSCASGN